MNRISNQESLYLADHTSKKVAASLSLQDPTLSAETTGRIALIPENSDLSPKIILSARPFCDTSPSHAWECFHIRHITLNKKRNYLFPTRSWIVLRILLVVSKFPRITNTSLASTLD